MRVPFLDLALVPRHSQPKLGGDNRDQTDNLLDANQMLSQLSYVPMMVPRAGFEPATFSM